MPTFAHVRPHTRITAAPISENVMAILCGSAIIGEVSRKLLAHIESVQRHELHVVVVVRVGHDQLRLAVLRVVIGQVVRV